MNIYRRLPLTGLINARELGGFPTPTGATKYGVFIRSELPKCLTENDKCFLKEYGVTADIDFRGNFETERTSDALKDEDWINYIHIPVFDAEVAGEGKSIRKLIDNDNFTWGDHYIEMVESRKDWVRNVFEAMSCEKAAVLYHCTTGKDRTGIITALLLGLCGVDRSDIVADYCVSQIYLQPIYQRMQKMLGENGRPADDPFFSTSPGHMTKLLDHFDNKYGSVAGYLEQCGVPGVILGKLKSKLS
jgi:protein-tyrosine phosphatase